jgi:hypothetical protein
MGWSASECLKFDLACVEYVERLEVEDAATIMVPVPSGKHEPMMPAPKWSKDDLLRFRGLDSETIHEVVHGRDDRVARLRTEILMGQAAWLDED